MQPDLPISSSPEFQKYTFVILIEELMMLSICPAGPRSSQGLKTLQQEITMVVSFRRINMSYLFCLHTHIAWYLFISFFCCSIYLFIFVVTQTSTSYSLFYINKTSIAPPPPLTLSGKAYRPPNKQPQKRILEEDAKPPRDRPQKLV